MALAVVDWRTRLLPTWLIAPAYVVTVVTILLGLAAGQPGPARPGAAPRSGWLIYGGLFFLLWFIYPRGLGYGDVRLSGVLGLALGWLGWGELLRRASGGGFLLGGDHRRPARPW